MSDTPRTDAMINGPFDGHVVPASFARKLEMELMDAYRLIVSYKDKLLPDHACGECVPYSDMLIDGFICVKHEAIKAIGEK